MALKLKISKAEFEKLSEELKLEYKQNGEEYVLDVSGVEDNGALKRAKDRESQLRKEAEEKAKLAEEELAKLRGDDARKNGDIATLEKAWKDKHDATENSYKEKLKAKDEFIKKSLVDQKALELATALNPEKPKVLLPHIKERLYADLESEVPTTKILDKEGKLSALTLKELEEEFRGNPDFSGVIVGSKASGSKRDVNEGQRKFNSEGKETDLASLNPKDLAAALDN